MNVDSIYQLQRDEAFALQFSAASYRTFVAMPFSSRGGYPEKRIWETFSKCHEAANVLRAGTSLREFSQVERADKNGGASAVVITDDIVRRILQSHFFVGDLTGGNHGVVLEVGIALAMKPNNRVILFTQDDISMLHFDLKVTNVNRYSEEDLSRKVAQALKDSAAEFEGDVGRYITHVTSRLTPHAVTLLNIYGQIATQQAGASLWEDVAAKVRPRLFGDAGRVAYHEALRELMAARLAWSDYRPNAEPGRDAYGAHATELGWRVIEHVWQHDPMMRKPAGAPTGPLARMVP